MTFGHSHGKPKRRLSGYRKPSYPACLPKKELEYCQRLYRRLGEKMPKVLTVSDVFTLFMRYDDHKRKKLKATTTTDDDDATKTMVVKKDKSTDDKKHKATTSTDEDATKTMVVKEDKSTDNKKGKAVKKPKGTTST